MSWNDNPVDTFIKKVKAAPPPPKQPETTPTPPTKNTGKGITLRHNTSYIATWGSG